MMLRFWRSLLGRLGTLKFFGRYLRVLLDHFVAFGFGASLPAVVLMIWSLFSWPPLWLSASILAGGFLLAGYYAWRDEHLKVSRPTFKTWISDMALIPTGTQAFRRLFVSLRIVNLGQPTSIHTWQGSYSMNGVNTSHLSDRMFVEDQQVAPPKEIRGNNLRRDTRMLQTGETREGWIAFDVGQIRSDAEASNVLRSVKLQFIDAFDNLHETSLEPPWVRERKS